MSKKKQLSLYIGQYVVIFLKGLNVAMANEEGQEIEFSMSVEGYFIDATTNYIHLGDTPDGVTRSVEITLVGVIEIGQSKEMNEIMKGMSIN